MTDPNLPPDFVASTYISLHPDLKKCTEQQSIEHYIHHGKKEGRMYNMNIPKNFDAEVYKSLNRDLANLDDTQAMVHYITHGKREGRIYNTNIIPKDFTPEKYRMMHYDLKKLTDNECIHHYIHHKRKYLNAICYNKYHHYCNTNHKNIELIKDNIQNGVPFNFSPSSYMKNFESLAEVEQKKIDPWTHYLSHGYHEQRLTEETDIVKQGSCLFFVAHESEITGAPIYLANLVSHYSKRNIFDNMCFLLPFAYNDNYYRELLPDNVTIIYYFNDLYVFLDLVIRYDPVFIYFNSIFTHFDNTILHEISERSVFHFHEDIKITPSLQRKYHFSYTGKIGL